MTDVIQGKEKENANDIFVTENNTFDINIAYYKKDDKVIVKNIDDDFDAENKGIKTLTLTLKYPSQGDCLAIEAIRSTILGNNNSLDVKALLSLEYNRLLILIRKWSLPEKPEESQIASMNPKIVKGIFHELRQRIGLDGLL